MGRKKKKEDNIDLIPVSPVEDAQIDLESDEGEARTEVLGQEPPQEEVTGLTDVLDEAPGAPESESSKLFGQYVSEENKWERKNRLREEKERAKSEKKRAKYANVDDDAYEKMKAKPLHKFFGMLTLFLLVAGLAMAALVVYKLVLAPSYAQVGEKEKNIHVEGFATDSDTSKYEQQVVALHGIATPSDLTDTWVEQPFTPATPTDVEEETQSMDGLESVPADSTTEAQEETQQ